MTNSNKPDRRELLKSIGIAGSIGVLGTTSASAGRGTHSEKRIEELEGLKEEYGTVKDAMSVIRGRGDKLLRDLAEHDILERSSTEQLRPDSLLSTAEYRDGSEGVHVTSFYEDGTATARIAVRRKTSDYVVKLYFHPQLSEEYAIVESRDEQNDAMVFDGGASVMGHCDYVGDYCSFYASWCTCGLEKYEVYACGTDCNKGDYLGCCCDGESTPC